MLTPIDEIANQNHLQLIKAAVAFLTPPTQRARSLLFKRLERRDRAAFFKKHGIVFRHDAASRGRIVLKCEVYMSILRC